MPDHQVFQLPDVGEGLTEADILSWHVQVGDRVAVNDTLVEIETAKSVVELPSPFGGVVAELRAAEGETVPVGAPLVTIAAADGAPEPEVPRVTEPVPTDDAPAVLVGTGPRRGAARRVFLRPPDGPAFQRARPAATAPAAPPAASEVTRIPIRGVRKATADKMVRSTSTAPHAGMWLTVDVTATMDLVRRLRGDRAWAGVRVSPLLLVARTVALAVQTHPEINASWDEVSQEIVQSPALNLGIAAATPRGLMVPNVKDAGSLSLAELAAALDDVVTRARDGRLQPFDLSGGTLTLTNVGSFGVDGATPILNPPEAAILALGAIQPRPWVVDGAVVVREVMTLSISIDHRLVDGELGAGVLRHVADLLHDPARALL